MGFAIYLVIALYGAAIMNGVLEEKRDKIVEVIVSSVRAPQIVIGKVLGIGARRFPANARLGSRLAWCITYAGSHRDDAQPGSRKGRAESTAMTAALPKVPLSVGIVFLLFFLGGFLIYSTIYASIGAIVTTMQEAQQLVFPAIMPLIIGFFMANGAAEKRGCEHVGHCQHDSIHIAAGHAGARGSSDQRLHLRSLSPLRYWS